MKATSSILPRSRHHVDGGERRPTGIDGEALVRALLAYKRGEPRVCAMVKAPTPEEEDRRRLCRERKVLIGERVRHVNRVKGLLFSQGISGYEPLRHDRRERLDTLQTGDGRLLPDHLKAQVRRELDRLELLLKQIKAVEAERDALLAVQQGAAPAPAAMLLNIKGIGPEFAAILWSEGLFRHFDNRRQVASYAGLAPTPWQSGSVDREQWQSAIANNTHPTRPAMAAQSAAIGAGSVVQGAGQPQWRPSQEDDHRGAGAQAAGGAVEICDSRRRHRGRHCEERLKGDQKKLKQSTGTRSVSADPGG